MKALQSAALAAMAIFYLAVAIQCVSGLPVNDGRSPVVSALPWLQP